MTHWLYQMNPKRVLEYGDVYTPEEFREDFASGEDLEWLTREIRPRGLEPKAVDTIFYWFVVSGTDEPGLYGFGIISDCYDCPRLSAKYKCISHRPGFPTEYLQAAPLYEDEIVEIVDDIRGVGRAYATMFKIDDDQAERLFDYIRNIDFG